MLIEQGKVVALESDAVWVETIRSGTCGSCVARAGCGHGLLNQVLGKVGNRVRVLPGSFQLSGIQIDDQVSIGIPEGVVLRGSVMVYLVPVLGLLIGATLGQLSAPGSDVIAMLGAAGGFLSALLLTRLYALRFHNDSRYHPALVEIPRNASMSPEIVEVF